MFLTVIVVFNIMGSFSDWIELISPVQVSIPVTSASFRILNAGRSAQTRKVHYQPVCSDRECHLLVGLLITECIPANQFIMVKRNAGRSFQTGNAIYWPVCQQPNAYRLVSLK